ncbi:MAG: hypothetical protein ACRDPS_06225 [Nocardioides sp.]|uniref:hypothetical protein n=1 Tax=Nocardioides sp. TaxID=35761 RepID=UPI003D6AB8E5
MTNISGGNRVGSRRGTRPSNGPRPPFILPAIATLGFLIVWGILVWVAVGFGADARGGESGAWTKLGIAAVAAVACLFFTFTFAGKAWRALTGTPTPPTDDYTGSHSNAYVEEQDYPEQDYYGSAGTYGYEDTGAYGRHTSDTGSQTAYGDTYGDTGSQPPYGDTGNRSQYGDTSNRSSFGDTGNRSAYTDTGSQSPYDYATGQTAYGDTGSRAAYGAPTYQPPPRPPQSSQPYYSSPPTPASTPRSPQGYDSQSYDSQSYGSGSYPTQQSSAPQYQSGAYQAPSSYGQTGSRSQLPPPEPPPTQAMPSQRQPQDPPAQQEDEWPPRRSSRNEQWPPATPENTYRRRH